MEPRERPRHSWAARGRDRAQEWEAAYRVIDTLTDEAFEDINDPTEEQQRVGAQVDACDGAARVALRFALFDAVWFGIWLATHGLAVRPPITAAKETR